MLQGYSFSSYVLSANSVHKIRECLQIILDYAETAKSEAVINQVHRIEVELGARRVNL